MGFIFIYSFGWVEPLRELFDYFFTTNYDQEGWISISPRIVKENCHLVSKDGSDPEITARSLMFSWGSKDSDDWKERFVFVRPRGSGSGIWSMCNGWTLDTKCKHLGIEAIKESANRIISISWEWKEEWLSNPMLSKAGLDGETYKCWPSPFFLTSFTFARHWFSLFSSRSWKSLGDNLFPHHRGDDSRFSWKQRTFCPD